MKGKEITAEEKIEALFTETNPQDGSCPDWAKDLAITYSSALQAELEKLKIELKTAKDFVDHRTGEGLELMDELEKARELLKKSIIFVDTRMHLSKEITAFINEGKK